MRLNLRPRHLEPRHEPFRIMCEADAAHAVS
jgi:hypothetical protein